MNDRLPVTRINFPSAPHEDLEQQAGGIVLDALREAGIDPRKAAGHAMVRQMLGMWGRGEWQRDEFVKACRNLTILNPALRAQTVGGTEP